MRRSYCIGLDVRKETVAIADAFSRTRAAPSCRGECGGSNLAVECAPRMLAAKLGVVLTALQVCFKAGPVGLVLARRVQRPGVR